MTTPARGLETSLTFSHHHRDVDDAGAYPFATRYKRAQPQVRDAASAMVNNVFQITNTPTDGLPRILVPIYGA